MTWLYMDTPLVSILLFFMLTNYAALNILDYKCKKTDGHSNSCINLHFHQQWRKDFISLQNYLFNTENQATS